MVGIGAGSFPVQGQKFPVPAADQTGSAGDSEVEEDEERSACKFEAVHWGSTGVV